MVIMKFWFFCDRITVSLSHRKVYMYAAENKLTLLFLIQRSLIKNKNTLHTWSGDWYLNETLKKKIFPFIRFRYFFTIITWKLSSACPKYSRSIHHEKLYTRFLLRIYIIFTVSTETFSHKYYTPHCKKSIYFVDAKFTI